MKQIELYGMDELKLFGRNINFNEEEKISIALTQQNIIEISKVTSQLEALYKKLDYGRVEVLEVFLESITQIIHNILQDICEELEIKNIVDTPELILSREGESLLEPLIPVLDQITNNYIDIVADEQAKIEYREMRKATRGRIVGGGFGVSGAVKGIAIAGGINMATGMVHSIFNGIGNSVTKATSKKNVQRLFEINRESVFHAIADTILNIEQYCRKRFQEYGYEVNCFTPKRAMQSENLFEEIKEKKISGEEYVKKMRTCVQLYPYNVDLYLHILERCGDANREIENLAMIFLINLNEEKLKILEEINSTLNYNNEESLKNGLNKINAEKKRLGIQEETITEKIIDKLKEYDLEARTVTALTMIDGRIAVGGTVVCESREIAERTKEAKAEFVELYNHIEAEDEEFYASKKRVDELSKLYDIGYVVQRVFSEKDVERRTYNGIEYKTIREKNEAIEQEKHIVDGVYYENRQDADRERKKIINGIHFSNVEEANKYRRESNVIKQISRGFSKSLEGRTEAYSKLIKMDFECEQSRRDVYELGKSIISSVEGESGNKLECGVLLIRILIFLALFLVSIVVCGGMILFSGIILKLVGLGIIIIAFEKLKDAIEEFGTEMTVNHEYEMIKQKYDLRQDGIYVKAYDLWIPREYEMKKDVEKKTENKEKMEVNRKQVGAIKRLCGVCGREIEQEWISCPYCGSKFCK